MSTIGQRIKELREKANLRQEDLGKRVGVTRSAVTLWEADKSAPVRTKLDALAAALGVTKQYLLFGQEEDETDRMQVLSAAQNLGIVHQDWPDAYAPPAVYPVASGVYGPIQQAEIVDSLAFKSDWLAQEFHTVPPDLSIVRETGDSMAPTIAPGDLMIIDLRFDKILGEGIYLLALGGALVPRRIQLRIDESLVIRPDNPAYETEFVAPGEAFDVAGRVLMVVKRL